MVALPPTFKPVPMEDCSVPCQMMHGIENAETHL
jgi:hypothetical protein